MSATAFATASDLHAGFVAFVEASQRLEASYAALRRRADAIDRELAVANQTLARTLAEKDAILQALPLAVLRVAPDGSVRWRNPSAVRLAALLPESELVALDDGETRREAMCLSVHRAALPDGDALVVVEDRSALAALESQVDRLDRLAGLSELALGIAHEIKNPLNGAMGFAALMAGSNDPGNLVRWAVKVREGLAQVDTIVKETLGFALGPRARHAQPLTEVLDAAAVQAQVPRSSVQLVGGAEHMTANAELVRVLANLFRNSVEAGATAITVRVAAAGDRWSVDVEDNGPGVPAALGNRVLEPAVSSKGSGRGLGLTLAGRVLAFLGGDIELINPGRAGARFRLTLPNPEFHAIG